MTQRGHEGHICLCWGSQILWLMGIVNCDKWWIDIPVEAEDHVSYVK